MGDKARYQAAKLGGIGARRARANKSGAKSSAPQPNGHHSNGAAKKLPPCSTKDWKESRDFKDLQFLCRMILMPIEMCGLMATFTYSLAADAPKLSPWFVEHYNKGKVALSDVENYLRNNPPRQTFLNALPDNEKIAFLEITQAEFEKYAGVFEQMGEALRKSQLANRAQHNQMAVSVAQMVGWIRRARDCAMTELVGAEPISPSDIRLAHDELTKAIGIHTFIVLGEVFGDRRMRFIHFPVSSQAKLARALFLVVRRLEPCINHVNALSAHTCDALREYGKKRGCSFHDIAFKNVVASCKRLYSTLRPDECFSRPDASFADITVEEIEANWDKVANDQLREFADSLEESIAMTDHLDFESMKLQISSKTLPKKVLDAIAAVGSGSDPIENATPRNHEKPGPKRQWQKLAEVITKCDRCLPTMSDKEIMKEYNQQFGGKHGYPKVESWKKVREVRANSKRWVSDVTLGGPLASTVVKLDPK